MGPTEVKNMTLFLPTFVEYLSVTTFGLPAFATLEDSCTKGCVREGKLV